VASFPIFSQEEETEKEVKNEFGFDGFANASTLGGSFGLGLKYAFVMNKNMVFGPSLRILRMWSNNNGQKFGFNILGGGGFFHYRFQNLFFAGVELEFMRSPIDFGYVLSPKQLVPTCFVGGGFSHEFENVGIRVNGGVFYDIINNYNSPFRTSYILSANQLELRPIIYRIGFFFPLN
jgi:hypothetical protein